VPIRAGDAPATRWSCKPGERVRVDGDHSRGARSGRESGPHHRGERIPVDKVARAISVFAGTVNGEGALVIHVTVAVGDRTLDRVITLVSEAQTQKAPTQQFTERFARVFVTGGVDRGRAPDRRPATRSGC
jgi:Cd2+/Zn2+-exporting ATPase